MQCLKIKKLNLLYTNPSFCDIIKMQRYKNQIERSDTTMKKRIITIARQYGSRGREIGKKLAEKLGYKYFDRDLISLAAEKSGYNKEILGEADE